MGNPNASMHPQQQYPVQPAYSQPGSPQHHPRLNWYITRTNGTIVPLIPADELPFHVRLEGVPRVLGPEQTVAMQFLATLPYTGVVFKAKDESATMQRSTSQNSTPPSHMRQTSNGKGYLAPDALARQAAVNAGGSPQNSYQTMHSRESSMNGRTSQAHPVDNGAGRNPASGGGVQSVIDAIVKSQGGADVAARVGYVPRSVIAANNPSGQAPDQEKKEYCTYWIRTGNCDYMQQGCMYKHEMPGKEMLEKIGFRSVPRWWAEKNQAIRLGNGDGRALVGSNAKPKAWLKRKSVVEKEDSEGSDWGSDSEVDTGSSKSEEKKGVATGSVLKESVKSVDAVEKKPESITASAAKAPVLGEVKVLKPSARTSTSMPAKEVSRTKNDDLIDFAALEPTSSSSLQPLTPATSAGSSPRMDTPAKSSPETTSQSKTCRTSSSPIKEIFVPKGESKDYHVADAKKRAARRSRRTPSPGQVASLDKQIQQAQKNKHAGGMMASKYAPAGSESRKEKGAQRSSKTGLRARRPAIVPAQVPTKSAVAAKAAEKVNEERN